MIPRITHSRSRLYSHMNSYEDGASSFFVSMDVYPELFDFSHSGISAKSPHGWRMSKTGKMKYLWFPGLDDQKLATIEDWRKKFEQYVLLGLNQHIEDYFSDELDFCMALDFNFVPQAERRSMFGEAEYQLKYQDSRQHFQVLRNALSEAIDDLPIPDEFRESLVLSNVPANPDPCSVPRKLAKAIAADRGYDFTDASLHCPKAALKGVSVDEKIPIWEGLYESDCVQLSAAVDDRLVVVIDDLYQSGATLWMYARFLRQQGARHVLGLPCVKSLRDTDNQ